MAQIHAAALEALETVGLSGVTDTAAEYCTKAGAELRDGRLYFPPALVEATVKSANRDFKLYGRDPKHDLHPIGHKVHFGTAGAAVHVVNVEANAYRDSTRWTFIMPPALPTCKTTCISFSAPWWRAIWKRRSTLI